MAKQRLLTEQQKTALETLELLQRFIGEQTYQKAINVVRKHFKIEPPLLTIREYIEWQTHGAYHTFVFNLLDYKVEIDSISDMLTDELCNLFPLTKDYYVIEDKKVDNGGDVENYHCIHNLTLEIKED